MASVEPAELIVRGLVFFVWGALWQLFFGRHRSWLGLFLTAIAFTTLGMLLIILFG